MYKGRDAPFYVYSIHWFTTPWKTDERRKKENENQTMD